MQYQITSLSIEVSGILSDTFYSLIAKRGTKGTNNKMTKVTLVIRYYIFVSLTRLYTNISNNS